MVIWQHRSTPEGQGRGEGNVCMGGIEHDSSTYIPLLWLVIWWSNKGTLRCDFMTLSFHHLLLVVHFLYHAWPGFHNIRTKDLQKFPLHGTSQQHYFRHLCAVIKQKKHNFMILPAVIVDFDLCLLAGIIFNCTTIFYVIALSLVHHKQC